MLIIETKNYNELSKRAAELIKDEINKKPNLVIGFATGKTPIGLYQELILSNKNKKVDFSRIISFNLDEYYPIKKINLYSYYSYMFKNLFDYINIKKENINLIDGETNNVKKECSSYEKKIKSKKIDLQILGIGINGHIGFNEPGTKIDSKTRVVKLTPETLDINSNHFKNNNIPFNAITIGISNILSSKKIILLASGKNKASAINQLVNGEVDSKFPVTFLKKHKNLIVIVDKEAGSLIDK